MANIKVQDDERCLVTFTHLNGKRAAFSFVCNPLTGDWLQTHRVGDDSSYYYSPSKDGAIKLANNIVEKSAENNLPCVVEISKNTLCP